MMSETPSLLVTHLENRLGRIKAGWTRDLRGKELPFQVAEFSGGGQLEGSTSYATVGLSEHKLAVPGREKSVWLELLMTTHSALAPARFPQVVQSVASALLAKHEAVSRGEVLSLPGTVADGSSMSSVYACIPGYFDEEFDSITNEKGVGIAIVWLVPVAESEVQYVDSHGWDAFEARLREHDPDLLDPFRAEIC
ncbi:suppressor of fused domain protein [Actinoplanes sp. NPDC051859]|uniref:suppressor of fused domain protein n=1 Tax=Actinoplanes sp. NPDC051859 TaxID=3363909 RepID=UPI00378F1396